MPDREADRRWSVVWRLEAPAPTRWLSSEPDPFSLPRVPGEPFLSAPLTVPPLRVSPLTVATVARGVRVSFPVRVRVRVRVREAPCRWRLRGAGGRAAPSPALDSEVFSGRASVRASRGSSGRVLDPVAVAGSEPVRSLRRLERMAKEMITSTTAPRRTIPTISAELLPEL